MPIRSARNPTRKATLAAAVALAAIAQGYAARGQDLKLGIGQARGLAIDALNAGDPVLADKVARGLLVADPKDPLAYFVIATAQARLDHPDTARRAAALAYRYSDTGIDRFRSAQLAARMAYEGKHPTAAQYWLRKSSVNAPDDRAEQVVARDYRALRAENPWAFRIGVDLRPSSNVNKGADSALQIIDGVPVTGWLSGAARALSGLIGSVDVTSSYRFSQTRDSETSIGGRLYVQRVALSSEAKAQAPTVTNGDFASTFGELSLRHAFRVGAPAAGGSAAVDLAIGESWSGGARSFRYARITGERNWTLASGVSLSAQALAENRFMARYRVNDANVVGLGAEIGKPLQNGDRLTWTFALRNTDARHPNGTYRSASMRIGYAFGHPVGPGRLSAGLVLGVSDYPEFWSAGFIKVPGGRQDQSIYGDVNLLLSDLDYAGFAPMLRLRAGRKTSNDSRYSMHEVSVSLSVQSKF